MHDIKHRVILSVIFFLIGACVTGWILTGTKTLQPQAVNSPASAIEPAGAQ